MAAVRARGSGRAAAGRFSCAALRRAEFRHVVVFVASLAALPLRAVVRAGVAGRAGQRGGGVVRPRAAARRVAARAAVRSSRSPRRT